MTDSVASSDSNARRRLLTAATAVLGGFGALAALVPFVAALRPSARTRAAGAPVEVDFTNLPPGTQQTVSWRGKPVWVLKRTPAMLDRLGENVHQLRDPRSEVMTQQPPYARNEYRSIEPAVFVCIALCTHLGCVPTFRPEVAPDDLGPDWHGGYFCPCHGSRFDLAGRVFRNVPAPTNLVVPPYRFADRGRIVVGEHPPSA